MPGSKSASDPPAWTTLAVEEAGGFAGLRRGAGLAHADASAAQARRIGDLLEAVREAAHAAPGSPAAMADGQTLSLHVGGDGGGWSARFDTADLPGSVVELLSCLPDLKPLPLD